LSRNALTIGSNACLQIESVRVRQHDVEHDQIRRQIPHRGKRARSVRRGANLEPLVPQSGRDELGDVRLVVHHQDAAALGRRSRHDSIM